MNIFASFSSVFFILSLSQYSFTTVVFKLLLFLRFLIFAIVKNFHFLNKKTLRNWLCKIECVNNKITLSINAFVFNYL